ncbi:hypothetical protein [Pantoea stewartii]|uniref:Uncharacterized protein n=1 Tax=Pantoea stewartii subsp. stewartii DC283 TaxID=660596 RepID=H3RBI3_PANSE|nr:hypothetical protein [Pantoea stewartii]ARF49627.1 hypothetical protein DSJ_09925 [Pantoea stewartii subsp. stewartii DC283]EHU01322.1 hypothetical protein CKS_4072 [Pantoea stewartii subsp. stewartii DC283]
MEIDNFEEAKNISEQLNVLVQVIYSSQLSNHEKDVLTGLSLNLSNELYHFCKAGFEKDEAE